MQVEEKYLERLSDISMEVYASTCALSRASRSYVVGHLHAEHEVLSPVSCLMSPVSRL